MFGSEQFVVLPMPLGSTDGGQEKSIITAFALDGIGLDALKVAVLLRIVEIIRFGERSFDPVIKGD